MTKLALAKVTRKGQMTIPQELREALGIESGDNVFALLGENQRGHRKAGKRRFLRISRHIEEESAS